ncbi:MAG: acetyl-CoA carboxylase biotin carboxyl carrier protein [Lewinellaceae bacterium]|nr:acetyl-CoA carboxylase biotin carboxyl carrier protein [Saprospiraceae bacterium]MCB9314118.1 acetyl-CoA carboxylase biotin carboxyl carrier protein [Lewinellaceae bacterium]
MDNKEIHELIKLINKTNLAEFKLKDGEFELTIRTDAYSRGRTETVIPIPAPVSVPAHAPAAPVPAPPAPAPAPAAEEKKDVKPSNLLEVKSPMVGTFYRSPSPEKGPFVQVGDHISQGDVVCIIEAMKLFNEIESEVSGKIVKMLVDDATPVEYDQVLFLVDPAG